MGQKVAETGWDGTGRYLEHACRQAGGQAGGRAGRRVGLAVAVGPGTCDEAQAG